MMMSVLCYVLFVVFVLCFLEWSMLFRLLSEIISLGMVLKRSLVLIVRMRVVVIIVGLGCSVM